jgi:hypothetical protein
MKPTLLNAHPVNHFYSNVIIKNVKSYIAHALNIGLLFICINLADESEAK